MTRDCAQSCSPPYSINKTFHAAIGESKTVSYFENRVEAAVRNLTQQMRLFEFGHSLLEQEALQYIHPCAILKRIIHMDMLTGGLRALN